jgi:hypothetical protein
VWINEVVELKGVSLGIYD